MNGQVDLTTWPHGTLAQIERHAIFAAVKRYGKLGAAHVLGIGKTTVYRKLAEYREQDKKAKQETTRKEIAAVEIGQQ